jgi:hypothetical protein
MNLLPEQYDFAGLDIHAAQLIQMKIRDRQDYLEGCMSQSPNEAGDKAVCEELSLMDLALDRHISKTIREEEAALKIRRKAKEEKKEASRTQTTPPICSDRCDDETAKYCSKIAVVCPKGQSFAEREKRKLDQGPPYND